MRKRAIFVLALFVFGAAAQSLAAEDAVRFQREFEKAARTILCNCGCPPQSVYDCACGHASELREQFTAEIRSGRSGQQVIDAWVAKYGEKIRIVPTASGFNLLAWIGPALTLIAGIAFTIFVLRRWNRSSASEPEPAIPLATVEDDVYLAELEQRLREER